MALFKFLDHRSRYSGSDRGRQIEKNQYFGFEVLRQIRQNTSKRTHTFQTSSTNLLNPRIRERYKLLGFLSGTYGGLNSSSTVCSPPQARLILSRFDQK